MSDTTGSRDPVDLLAEEFSARLRAGEAPSIDDYARRCPELAASIWAIFPSIALVERVSNQEYTGRQSQRRTNRLAEVPIKTLGDFRILREVGRGGMGIVYEAVQSSLNRRVALKVLGPHVAGSATQLRRFRREAEAAARLHHTNIVPIYGIGEEAGLHFYAMQFIEGTSLGEVIHSVSRLIRLSEEGGPAIAAKTLLATNQDGSSASVVYPPDVAAWSLLRGVGPGRRPPSGLAARGDTPSHAIDAAECESASGCGVSHGEPVLQSHKAATAASGERDLEGDAPGIGDRYWRGIARIVAEIADALSYAHRHGVLHRDIKPSNLLLDREGVIWVADFGLAKQEDQEGITNDGDIVGTLRYMAPEQFNGHTDVRSDIYSLGLTLFELLSLRPAYDEGRHGPLIKSKTREAPIPLRAFHPHIPADLETITLKTCALDPDHRYQSAEELAEDLIRFLEGRPIRARRVTAPERLWRWCRRNPAVACLGSATFLLLLTVAIVFAIGNYRTRRALTILEREHARAETNLGLAIRAFEQIIGNISSRGIAEPPAMNLGSVELIAPETVLTAADAELLETLLAFFERFANENGTDLKVESASARKHLGDIQQRLGRFVEAEATYREALDAYTALSKQDRDVGGWIVVRANILNEIGVTASRRGAFMRATEHHVEARQLLEHSDPTLASRTGRFELARTLMLLCSIKSRNGVDSLLESLVPVPPGGPRADPEPGRFGDPPFGGRPWRRPGDESLFPGDRPFEWKTVINQAIVLLQGLLAEDSKNPEYRLYLARSYRERVRIARLGRDRELSELSLKTAVDYLDRLVSDFPTHPGYKSALAEMLWTTLSFPGAPEFDPETVQRTERAVALSKELLAAYPHIPDYRVLNGSALYRLASLQQVSGHPEQAEKTYRQAIAFQESLTRQFPSVLHNSIALADSLQKLAEVEVVLERPEEAVTDLESAIAHLERFPKHDAARFLPGLIQRLRERQAAIRIDSSSNPPQATDATTPQRPPGQAVRTP